jgi:16S rRNA C967 or C1407 C5-methylase (RsmB/RsmF family)/NOL1/NOP2/fmu family ribosome biogenesis protein
MQLPERLINDLKGINGFDEKAFIEAHERESVTSIRLHPVKHSDLFNDKEEVSWCESGRYLESRPVFTLDPLYHAGAYYVQEASSMFLHYVWKYILQDKKNLRVLDLCAAPGGKSTLIASLLDRSSLLISNEVIRTRASILEENMTRWGYMNTWVTSNDPKEFAKLAGYFDVIVVDAPCSGSGLFRKDKNALEEWSEDNVALCAQRQQRILADVWPALKENGILIYATCSYSTQEDEEILDWLGNSFDVESINIQTPEEWGIVPAISPNKKMNCYRFFPDKVKGEGFFIAALQKCECADEIRYKKYKPEHNAKIFSQATNLLDIKDVCCIQLRDEGYSAIRQEHEQDFHLLKDMLYLRKTGLLLGMPAVKEWIPAHDVALSVDASKDIQCVDVDKQQALFFLKKEVVEWGKINNGWNIVKYKGLGLGWIKNIGNRVNNYLPKHWRIRMELTDADWK